jgi:hypothetical protein
VRRALSLLAVPAAVVAAGAALTAAAAPTVQTNECKGLKVCVRVAGPWVVVPSTLRVPRPQVEFTVTCPRGYVVGGLDAELSDRAIDVFFQATLGSPVNPGISTGRAAVFVARYVGATARGAPSFRPHIGCMPSSGGGGRIQTSVSAFKPGAPTVRRVKNVKVRPGSQRAVASCRPRERLVAAAQAFAFGGKTPPSAQAVARLRGAYAIAGRRVIASVHADPLVLTTPALVQVDAVCARVP